jgi:adenosine deaminase
VHVISPSTYDEKRFQKLVKDLKELNIGIITCPSAAISMRQYRHLTTPTYNSIARVLDFMAAGIHVRMGSDNICDITSPAGTLDLMDEIFVLCNAMRYYDIETWAQIAAGKQLDSLSIQKLNEHLSRERDYFA